MRLLCLIAIAMLSVGVVRAGDNDPEESQRFWSFQTPVEPPIPRVQKPGWAVSELDRFVLANLEEHSLNPAPPADRATLLRRTTMTLTGLPPTPQEVDSFVADLSPDALECLVDRLLHSPHYGERWGRHWLDVARYADSNGLDENIHHGNGWRYRDYVATSLNRDKPFDRFVTEQIAGDLLPSESDGNDRSECLIATGFLAIGPKVLAEPDETKMELDIIDEQLDTLGRAIMGLTLGCARCHDHKFDPISADDYYALAGIFKSTRTMEQYTKVARWWEHPIPTPDDRARQAAHEQELTAAKERIEQFVSEANRTAGDVPSLEDAAQENLEAAYPAGIKTRLKRLRDELAKLEENPPEISSAMGVGERAVRDLPVHIRGSHLAIGEPVPRRFPAVLVAGKQPIFDRQRSGRLRLAAWLTSEHHPLTCRVFVNRIWRWHFGRGLVATPDNFGNLGERPVNQPLLDWLAVRFRENAWSIKWLHRVILSSTTWRMSSRLDRRAAELDPENRLQWRSNMRRLEAEAIRDSILAVSGQLDRSMGGTLITLGNRAYFFDHTSKDTTEYRSNRRSIYLPVVRNHLYEMFSLFDYSDAGSVVGSRETSTVAPQALFMMNSDFVHRASEALAKQLCSQEQSDEARIRSLYRRVLCRDPAPHEVLSSLEFLGRAAADFDEPEAWPLLCQVVLSSNEFVYLR